MVYPSPPTLTSHGPDAETQVDQLSVILSAEGHAKFARELPLWGNSSEISISYLDGTQDQKDFLKAIFGEFSTYANIQFAFLKDNNIDAHIRVSFNGDDSWSSLGKNALEVKSGPTLNLGFDATGLNRATALHQVARALAIDDFWYSTLPEANYTSVVDIKDKKDDPTKANLSEFDIAWLIINYPGKPGVEGWDLEKAFKTLNIPYVRASRADPRRAYADFTSSKAQDALHGLVRASKLVGEAPVENKDLLHAVALHPKFRQGIANIIKYQIHSSLPHIHFPELDTRKALWDLLMDSLLGNTICHRHGIPIGTFADASEFYPDQQRKLLQEMVDLAYREGSAPLPADIQEGIHITWGKSGGGRSRRRPRPKKA